jgi:uncharacterized protein (DUF488 family)
MTATVYTIGHSTHTIERFIDLLKQHHISAVCDVRSRPYSRMNPQFNREDLRSSLKAADIKYVFLGKELGARSDDKSCYRNGQIQYDLLAKTSLFNEGIERVIEGSNNYRIALMCAEKEPLDCHRTILVSRTLCDRGVEIEHILGDGRIEAHGHAIERLVDRLRVLGADMFRKPDEVIADAYKRQGNDIAYREDVPEGQSKEQQSHSTFRAAE